jgi:uncharacterized protein YbjT (DUF2867 family)
VDGPVRVLLIGASGLIGSAVRARLAADGHRVVGVTRRASLAAGDIRLDLAHAARPEVWTPHLRGIDAVINCAGVLQGSPGQSTNRVHSEAVAALAKACEETGIRRFVHVSAIGAERGATDFARTKKAGEQAIQATRLEWVIVRPSVVVGRAAYGGSALFRALAASPILGEVPGTGEIQIVQLDDVVSAIAFFAKPDAPARLTVEAVGPDRLLVTDIVLAYRRWFGWPPPKRIAVPPWLWRQMCLAGDAMRLLGWRSPISSTLYREALAGATGDPAPLTRITGIVPRSLSAALAAEPASVQERWFARLYLLKPLVFVVLVLFWIGTGLISLGPGFARGMDYMEAAGVGGSVGAFGVVVGALADIILGIGVAIRRTAAWALRGTLLLSLFYVAAGTLLLPSLWLDPLGPMLKIWPVLALNLVAIAILSDR